MSSEAAVERYADRLEEQTIRRSNAAYSAAMRDVLRKHKATLDKVEALEVKGDYRAVRRLVRSSGLLDDMAQALALAGRQSAEIIRGMMGAEREAVRDESS